MRVEVEAEAWACGRADVYRELHRLLTRAATGQHTVLALGDPAAVINGAFFEQMVPPAVEVEWKELLTRTLAASAHEAAPPRRALVGTEQVFSRDSATGYTLAATDVGEWAEEHLQVLLENDTDWLLVRWAACVAAERGSESLECAVQRGWVRKNGRGGTGELHKAVKAPPQHR